jgi:hypothetical protein
LAIWSQFNDLDCRKCNSQIKKIRGCVEKGKEVEIEGFKIDRCPLALSNELTAVYLDLFFYFRNGFLPNPYGWLKQPMKLCSVLIFMENLIDKYTEKKDARTGNQYPHKAY